MNNTLLTYNGSQDRERETAESNVLLVERICTRQQTTLISRSNASSTHGLSAEDQAEQKSKATQSMVLHDTDNIDKIR